jgi:dienelactone hydrolase
MNKLIGYALAAVAAWGMTAAAQAEVQRKAVGYQHEGVQLNGLLYWDDAIEGPRPGVLLIHEWWGLNDYAQHRARMLAELGYAVFAADMYGGNRVTDQPGQAREWMQEVTSDVALWRERADLGLAQLKASGLVDGDNVAAIGYCFGGGTVLQMAYGGADLKGVAGFHASLPAAPEEAKGRIGAEILVLQGGADAWAGPDVVQNFQAKLNDAGASWELVSYGGARHGFTNPDVGQYGIDNLKYDAKADARSWARLQEFFTELFSD